MSAKYFLNNSNLFPAASNFFSDNGRPNSVTFSAKPAYDSYFWVSVVIGIIWFALSFGGGIYCLSKLSVNYSTNFKTLLPFLFAIWLLVIYLGRFLIDQVIKTIRSSVDTGDYLPQFSAGFAVAIVTSSTAKIIVQYTNG